MKFESDTIADFLENLSLELEKNWKNSRQHDSRRKSMLYVDMCGYWLTQDLLSCYVTVTSLGDEQNTEPQSMNFPNGLPYWTTLKWTTPKNNNPNEYHLMFLAASIIKLHKSSACVHPVQPLATSLNNCTWNKQLLNTN